MFLLKFAKPEFRQQLIIETGFRCHLTDFNRATAPTPSGFVTRLRKYLKSRRVTSVSQVETDRIIEIQFSDGRYHLFLEFFAAGNIILTDDDFKILAIYRMVPEGADQEQLRVGSVYLINHRQNYLGDSNLTDDRLRDSLQRAIDEVGDDTKTNGKQAKVAKNHTLRKALVISLREFSPLLVDNALRTARFDPSVTVKDILAEDTLFFRLLLALVEAQKIVEDVMKSDTPKGYIIAKTRKSSTYDIDKQTGFVLNPSLERNENYLYEEYHPFIPQQYMDNPEFKIIELDSFNKTVDEFYSSIEAQHVQSRLLERDENAKRKLEAARQNHEKRLDRLQQTQESHFRKATALEANLQSVQEAIAAINGLIAQGMGWVEIERLISMEQAKHNDIAEMIKLPLKLSENTITLLLKPPCFDDEDDYAGSESESSVSSSEVDRAETEGANKTATCPEGRIAIDVDLGLSPWSNARLYYGQKKTAAIKEQKTLQSSVKALKSTERKINADLKKALTQEKETLRPVRKPFWFEKFIFFISSEGYIVLGGRDMHQSDILYTKHLKKGDVYVHADLHGVATVIIKNKTGLSQSPIPPTTLTEAGTLAVITSSAWDSKAVMSAWWVPAEQVSKISAVGEYLPSGEFAILGQKNFLPPAQLLLGFGVMFHISAESKLTHFKNRVPMENITQPDDVMEDNGITEAGSGENEAERGDRGKSCVQGQSHPRPTGRSDYSEASTSDSESLSRKMVEEEVRFSNLADSNVEQVGITLEADSEIYAARKGQVPGPKDAITADKPRVKESLDGDLSQSRNLIEPNNLLLATHHSSAEKDSNVGRGGQHAKIDDSPTVRELVVEQHTGMLSPVSNQTSKSSAQAKSGKKYSVRGKQGKIKKANSRYGDQDAEDRKAALGLLGSAAAQAKAEKDILAQVARQQELEAQKQRRRQRMDLAAAKGKEIEQLRYMSFQAENDQSDCEEVEAGPDLETFVGTVRPGDEILDAFIVCGPWNAVGTRCRWKAKVQPGAMKKGKVVREILAKWSDDIKEQERRTIRHNDSAFERNEDSTAQRERELLKGFKEQEVVGVIPVSKCRVMVGAAKTKDGKSKGTNQRRGLSHEPPRASK